MDGDRAAVLRAARDRVDPARRQEALVRDLEELPRVQPGHTHRLAFAGRHHTGHPARGRQATQRAEVHAGAAPPPPPPPPARPPPPPSPGPPRAPGPDRGRRHAPAPSDPPAPPPRRPPPPPPPPPPP